MNICVCMRKHKHARAHTHTHYIVYNVHTQMCLRCNVDINKQDPKRHGTLGYFLLSANIHFITEAISHTAFANPPPASPVLKMPCHEAGAAMQKALLDARSYLHTVLCAHAIFEIQWNLSLIKHQHILKLKKRT